MIRRSRDVQVFNVSFLDLLSCALGGVLLLLLITMSNAQQQAKSLKTQLTDLEKKKLKLTEDLGKSQNAIEELIKKQTALLEKQSGLVKAKAVAQDTIDNLKNIKAQLEQAQATLIGIKGDLKATVFVFDTSGSMDTKRFNEYIGMLKYWIKHLNHDHFNVIQFFGTPKEVKTWRHGEMVKSTKENRKLASEFVDTFKPKGKTPTRAALKTAFDLGKVNTIILFSDGAPTDETDYKKILKEVSQWQTSRRVRITINTIGMGNYFEGNYGDFLQKLAAENGGVFIGR